MLGPDLVHRSVHLCYLHYWKGLTRAGAVSGMVSGALVVIVWIAWIKPLAHINEIFGL